MIVKNTTIRARAPLRLGLAGGGTDVSPYSDEFGGHILNVTIDKYAYATIQTRSDGKVSFIAADNGKEWVGNMSSEIQRVPGLDLHAGVYNRVIKEFNNFVPIPVTIITHSEAPPGSGLGSSSTMVVAIVQAFCELLSLPLGDYEIAQLAYKIEREDLKFAGGKQDQYAATFGGFNFMEFYKDKVIVNPLRIKPHIKAELESSLVLFYTGVSRESAKIIDEQANNIKTGQKQSLDALHAVKAEAQLMKEAILKADFSAFVSSMQQGWASKKQMAKSISNPLIDEIYDAAIKAGASCGKVSGAGGGGFIMFFVEPTLRPNLMKVLSKFEGQVSTCSFTDFGSHAWRKE
ncbi:dehydrogenase [Methylophilus sp. TWE2]|uniref:GHMP family kinase ATP-binding protein n=1 Tax=Methylophilus sp. TWE2 TaxID=1662285 RepID=UPI000670DB69|nr:dehydrogenase [Methylophilus sp. TWE2]AKR43379.1 dehydrogenase [Methylophilus sp. TWE2]